MNLEHNEEVQLIAPLQIWGRHGAVGLGAEEGHQDGPELQRVSGRATEKPVPSSACAARGWLSSRAEGSLPGPAALMAGTRQAQARAR